MLQGEAATGAAPRGPSLNCLGGRSTSAAQLVDKVVKRFPGWSPPTHRQARAYAKSFDLRGQLLAVYDCTVQLKLQHQGYLYLTRTHVCFEAVNLAMRGIQFVISIDDIKEVISGGSRDIATLVLKRTVQLRERRLSLNSIELRGCEAGSAAIAALLARQDEDEDDDDEMVDSAAEGTATENGVPATPSSPNDATPSRVLAAFNNEEPFRSLFKAHLPSLRLGQLGEELIAGDWTSGSFLLRYLEKQGATEIAPAPWIDDAGGGTPSHSPMASLLRIREVTMKMPVPPAPMCPKITRMTTTFCIKVNLLPDGEASIEIQTSAISHDVPFGDKFLVQELIKLEPSQGGTSLCKSGRVIFLKSCGLFTSRIKSSSANQCTVTAEMMASLLQARATPAVDASPSAPAVRTTCTVQILELQRRVTLWSRTWMPPFLPHDGRKRWRWVDTTYQVHAWTSVGTREAAQACVKPPITPQGWVAQCEWDVLYPANGDPEGWQYAIDFYHREKYWGENSYGCHVRRRLWHCEFVQTE